MQLSLSTAGGIIDVCVDCEPDLEMARAWQAILRRVHLIELNMTATAVTARLIGVGHRRMVSRTIAPAGGVSGLV